MGPILKDTVGIGQDVSMISSTVAQQSVLVSRVVSYNEDSTGKLTNSVLGTGVVSDKAKLWLFVKFNSSTADAGRQVQVVFSSFNNVPLSNTAITYTLGQDGVKQGAPATVSTQDMHFGQATFNPVTTPAAKTTGPTLGLNSLTFSVNYINFDGKGDLQGPFVCFVYSFVEFDAMAPIILVHGTAASHTSWQVPDSGTVIEGIPFDPVVQMDATHPGYFGYQQGPFQGVWFYYIDLGPKKGGNDGILASANQLAEQLFTVLDALGARACHVIAHSKGGSDTRQMIIDEINSRKLVIANSTNKRDLENKYRILSLYSIGTPHLGTPLSNIGVEVEQSVRRGVFSNYAVYSADPDINTIIGWTTATAVLHKGPSGDALRDQVVGGPDSTLRKLWSADQTQAATAGHFYGLGGDADLNGDAVIEHDEGSYYGPNSYSPLPSGALTHLYGVVGRVADIKVIRGVVNPGTPFEYPYVALIPYLVSNTPEPNDLVTPIWSVLGPGAKPFQVQASGFVLRSGQPAQFGNSSYNASFTFAQFLSPGDHMLLKRNENISQIVSQIQSDYPVAIF